MVTAAWLAGEVMHARGGEAGFCYPVRYLCLPVEGIEELAQPLLGIDRRRPFAIRQRDYGDQSPDMRLAEWIAAQKEAAGLAAADGPTMLLTVPRMLGYAFNPVSFWLCLDRERRLRAVLCEVHNTFGERHCYWVHRPDQAPLASSDGLRCAKVFHVSPFLPVAGEYRMRFAWPQDGQGRFSAWIRWRDDASGLELNTRLSGPLRPLRRWTLARWLLAAPANAAAIPLRIHWQALRLWLRRKRFFRKPAPPEELVSPMRREGP
ncbi:MAG: DUF1365 domain-containing protein [Betaproteobacteria bacterium AqS2]|uniref:DUF1365 domain-containing protein n=1 Tax=Candidatus Amphirhobacter heronislandensis TaxID=1732024 RepID=A0A930UDG6_9GAMM|nr:DUF1365 domain-containing protein [Betaproteobacteria bacterium AqS2]